MTPISALIDRVSAATAGVGIGPNSNTSHPALVNPVTIAGVSTVTPRYPNTVIEMPNFATDSAVGASVPDTPFRDSITKAAYEQAGVGPEDLDLMAGGTL